MSSLLYVATSVLNAIIIIITFYLLNIRNKHKVLVSDLLNICFFSKKLEDQKIEKIKSLVFEASDDYRKHNTEVYIQVNSQGDKS